MSDMAELGFWGGIIKEVLALLSGSQVVVLEVLLALLGLGCLIVKTGRPPAWRVLLAALAVGVLMAAFGILVLCFCPQ